MCGSGIRVLDLGFRASSPKLAWLNTRLTRHTHELYWVAVQEPHLGYYLGETT